MRMVTLALLLAGSFALVQFEAQQIVQAACHRCQENAVPEANGSNEVDVDSNSGFDFHHEIVVGVLCDTVYYDARWVDTKIQSGLTVTPSTAEVTIHGIGPAQDVWESFMNFNYAGTLSFCDEDGTIELYVDWEDDDSNSGTIDGPVITVKANPGNC